jgi:hypothetical protein
MQKHGYVYNKSSLDVIGMFLEMVRSRFVQPDNSKFPWQWNADDKKSRIVIEAASNPYLWGHNDGLRLTVQRRECSSRRHSGSAHGDEC